MSDTVSEQDKFIKIISKAILGGWDKDYAAGIIPIIGEMFSEEYPEAKNSMLRSVLLDHDFSRAFFGDHPVCVNCGKPTAEPASDNCHRHKFWEQEWEFCLKQAVLSEDIISYYYERI